MSTENKSALTVDALVAKLLELDSDLKVKVGQKWVIGVRKQNAPSKPYIEIVVKE